MPQLEVFNSGERLWQNGRVAILRNLIFGTMVWDGQTWVSFSSLSEDDKEVVRRAVLESPMYLPEEAHAELWPRKEEGKK